MNKERLESLEKEVKAELETIHGVDSPIHYPIADGVIDIDQYLVSRPKMLWILKEAWEPLEEGESGGDWSIPKFLKEHGGKIGNTGTWANMAFIAYSVFHNFTRYSEIPWATDDPKVGESLRKIAYINVNKFPGKSISSPAKIESFYGKNRSILLKQIETIDAEIVIGGNTLHLFFNDLGLRRDEFQSEGSASFCEKNGRLYIWAYHPSQRSVKRNAYVDDIVTVIKNRHGN